jgi:hypothetical protein
MKTLILFLIILFPVRVFAQCERAAAAFGDGEGNDTIPAECFKAAEKIALPAAKKIYPDFKMTVIGVKNIVFVNSSVIAGEYTKLQDVIAVAYDKKNNEVAALEKNGDVLIFSARITGNVAPLRVIRHRDLDGASDLSFLPEKEEVAVLIPGRQEVLTFSRLANFYGREGERKLNIRRQIAGQAKLPGVN